MVNKFLSDLKVSDDTIDVLRKGFTCVTIELGSSDYESLVSKFPNLTCPLFTIIQHDTIQTIISPEDSVEAFKLKLQELKRTPKPSGSVFVPYKHVYKNDHERLRALIYADKCERRSMQRSYLGSSEQEVTPSMLSSESVCTLSIRLLHGEMVRCQFNSDDTLVDVKRWLEKEKGLLFAPEDETSMPSFASKSSPKVINYAFCYLSIPRVTFSEGQELMRIRDLGLCPRLALILKPVYQQEHCTEHVRKGAWQGLTSKLKNMASALYTFFDYGVEDAERDWNYLSDLVENESQPAFVIHDPSKDVSAESRNEGVQEEQIATFVDGRDMPMTLGGTPLGIDRGTDVAN